MKRWLTLDDEAFQAELAERFRGTRQSEPAFWRDPRFNHAAQPVVGVCWYEVRAYCAWLSAQTGLAMRLPTEVEWEAAARGSDARAYAYGDVFDRLRANTIETRVRRTTPVGVFPDGRTPEGVDDLSGNAQEWTSSLFGEVGGAPWSYPYDPEDGRESPVADPGVYRVIRCGDYMDSPALARATFRFDAFHDAGWRRLGCGCGGGTAP